MEPLLSATNLCLPPRLRDLDIDLHHGEVLGLLGVNGAGKSSVLAALAGVLPLTDGEVRYRGRALHTHPRLRRHIGWLPQHAPLYGDMTVEDNLRFRAGLQGCDAGAVAAALDQFSLGGLRRRLAARLSGGERMRLGLACCLVHRPQVLLLDEPTAGLDAVQTEQLHQLIRNLAGDRAVLIASHLLPDIEALCQRALLLHQGRIVADEPIHPPGRRMLAEFSHPPGDEALLQVPGVAAVYSRDHHRVILELAPDASPTMPEELAGQGWGLRRWHPASSDLLTRFRQLSSGEHA
jgi:ABC-2 type transport system ATP-binding protein